MPDLLQKKVGLVSCSGEELPEGTVTRLATLRVLEQLRPADTVTICLPLFLAGGEGDRAFARFYPTIAIDGCDKRCAHHGTAKYSNEPAASIVITNLVKKNDLAKPDGLRQLNKSGEQAVELAAYEIAAQVDSILGRSWNRADGKFAQSSPSGQEPAGTEATCSCGSGIPIQKIMVNQTEQIVVGLPLIFKNFREQMKAPSKAVTDELMQMVKIYNRIDPNMETDICTAIEGLYQSFYLEGSQ
jgi:uncharacterized metal-binding protein